MDELRPFAVEEISRFVTNRTGKVFEPIAPPRDSSGRRPAWIIPSADRAIFAKFITGSDASNKMRTERAALEKMAQIEGVRVPHIIGIFEKKNAAALVMDAVEQPDPRSMDWAQLADMVAALHKATGKKFGLDHDNYIGPFLQDNAPLDSWNEFFVQRQLLPMLGRARDKDLLSDSQIKTIEQVAERSDEIAPDQPRPTLVHGDLWPGNVVFDDEGPLLIDPASYYGNRETDIAFGLMARHLSFPHEFYERYDEVFPLPDGYQERWPLWQLFPLLTHVVQDGRKWLPRLMNAAGRALGQSTDLGVEGL